MTTPETTPDTAAGDPPVQVRATAYSVSALPDDRLEGSSWTITVRYIGAWQYGQPRPADQQWMIEHQGQYLGRDGQWTPIETGAWCEEHRFSGEEALRLAQQAAPNLVLNGLTPADVLDRRRQRAAGAGTDA